MSQNDRDNFRKVTHPGMVNDDDFGQHRHYTWIGCGTFLVRCNTSPNSHRWGMGSSHITKVCHIICHRRFSFRSYGNRRSKSGPPAVFTLVAYLGRWDLRCRNRDYLGRQLCYANHSCGGGYGNRFLLPMVRLLSKTKTRSLHWFCLRQQILLWKREQTLSRGTVSFKIGRDGLALA